MSDELQKDKLQENRERTSFFLKNLLRGLAWLVVIVGGYFFLKKNFDFSLADILGPFYENVPAIFTIFLLSEVVFGIIPPELFMIWGLRHESLELYIQNVVALALISYSAGIIGYYIGHIFGETRLYRWIRRYYLRKFDEQFNRFGGFLVIVAAMTPLPFSGICMLVGAVKYPFRRFLIISTTRLVRFGAYAFIVWEANVI